MTSFEIQEGLRGIFKDGCDLSNEQYRALELLADMHRLSMKSGTNMRYYRGFRNGIIAFLDECGSITTPQADALAKLFEKIEMDGIRQREAAEAST